MGVKKGAIPLAGNVHIDEFALSVVHTDCWCRHFGEFQGCEMEMRSFGLTQMYLRSALSSKRCPCPCEHRQLRMADISMLRMLDAEQAGPADSIRSRNSVARCGRHLAPVHISHLASLHKRNSPVAAAAAAAAAAAEWRTRIYLSITRAQEKQQRCGVRTGIQL